MAFDPKYFGVPPSEQISKENRYAYTATAGQTTFSAAYTKGYGPDVYYNGSHLDPRTQFTAADGATVVLSTGADLGASIVIVAKAQVPSYDFYTQAQTNALVANFYASSTSGTTSAITATTNPSFTSWLFDGMEVKVRMSVANPNGTTAPTISLNGMSALTIVRDGQQPLTGGDWVANEEVTLRYSAGSGTLSLVSGRVTGITPTQLDNSSKYATTGFVQRALGNRQNLNGINANYTAVAADVGKVIAANVTGLTLTLPLSTSLPAGSVIGSYANIPSGTMAFAVQGSDKLNVGGSGQLLTTASIYYGESCDWVTDGAGNWYAVGRSAFLGNTGSFLNVKGTSGYQKLPSGIIMQWGTGTTTTGGPATFTYPIPFPTGVMTSVGTVIASNSTLSTLALSPGTSSIIASTYNTATSAYTAASVDYLVFGY